MSSHESRTWVVTSIFVGLFLALLAAAFLPLVECPACEDSRQDFAGINPAFIRRLECNVCGKWIGEQNRASFLKSWRYRHKQRLNK
jgi:hypothetical protein